MPVGILDESPIAHGWPRVLRAEKQPVFLVGQPTEPIDPVSTPTSHTVVSVWAMGVFDLLPFK